MWNGAFGLRKEIGRIRYVPLSQMTARDWAWLDYDGIRTVARNRIANAAVKGQLKGFFQVMIVEKAAKNEYFWPATPAEIEAFATTGGHNFFRHVKESDEESVAAEALDRLRAGFFGIPLWALLLLLRILAERMNEEDAEQVQALSEDFLEPVEEDDIRLLVSAIMLWELSLEEAEKIIDDFPESDEVDEVRDWINDRLREIEEAHRTIAAGRGIS